MIQDSNKAKKIFWPQISTEPGSVNYVSPGPVIEYNPMPAKMRNLLVGEIVLVSSGEYSDYCVSGVFKVLKEIDPNLFLQGWLTAHPEQKEEYAFHYMNFVDWLVELEFLLEIKIVEWLVASYSKSAEMDIRD